MATNNRHQPQDLWGHVKIPNLDRIASRSSETADGWFDVPPAINLSTDDFVSLTGIPVLGRNPNQDATFNLETSQMHVHCGKFKETVVPYFNHTKLIEFVPQLRKPSVSYDANKTDDPFERSTFLLRMDESEQLLDTRIDAFFGNVNKTREPLSRRSLTYVFHLDTFQDLDAFPDPDNGRSRLYRTVKAVNCTVSQSHSEAAIRCTKEGCAAFRLRKSRTDHRPAEVTPLDHSILSIMLDFLPQSIIWSRSSSPTEQFIFDTNAFPFMSPTLNDAGKQGWVDTSLVPIKTMSTRLSLLLNTYYQLTLAPNAFGGRLSANLSMYGPDTIPATDVDVYLPHNLSTTNTTLSDWFSEFSDRVWRSDIAFIGATTNATVSTPQEIFQCNFAWLAALFAAGGIIFATGMGSLILKHRTLGPEMFGFVASMTYNENPFVKLPQGGSALDAMERARLLRDVEFRVGDVKGEEEVGHIAFAAGVPTRKLEKGRVYA